MWTCTSVPEPFSNCTGAGSVVYHMAEMAHIIPLGGDYRQVRSSCGRAANLLALAVWLDSTRLLDETTTLARELS